MGERKLDDKQREEGVFRCQHGETGSELAKEFGVTPQTICRVAGKADGKQAKAAMPPRESPAKAIREFTKRAKSILWREDHGAAKKTYDRWGQRVRELKEGAAGYTQEQAVIQASKEFPCLAKLFREYQQANYYDPHPESHPMTQPNGPSHVSMAGIISEGVAQSYRENLAWAMSAAGEYLRTGQHPTSCPNDAALYLYCQAIESPREFMQQVRQVEGRADDPGASAGRRAAKRSIEEIEQMLEALDEE